MPGDPVIGVDEPFVWGVWVSLSEQSYESYDDSYEWPVRAHVGPLFGRLSAALPYYPGTSGLKVNLHLRDGLIRPSIELEPTDHPLAIEQREWISVDRLSEIYASIMHRHA